MANIEIYTKKNCPYCDRVKTLFNCKQVLFSEIPIDNDVNMREKMIKRSGHITVPQIFIDGEYFGGCDDLYTLNACGNLDSLLK